MTKQMLKKGIMLVNFLEDKDISWEELTVLVKEMDRVKSKNKLKKDLLSLTPHVRLLYGKTEATKYVQKRSHTYRRTG